MSPFAQSFASTQQNIIAPTRSCLSFLKEHLVWINIASCVGVVLFALIDIVQVNGSISKGYEMRDLETQIQEFALRNQTLELEMQRVQSLDHIAHSVKMLGLVDAGRPEFSSIKEPVYALAQ